MQPLKGELRQDVDIVLKLARVEALQFVQQVHCKV